jgi:hypothetical protein
MKRILCFNLVTLVAGSLLAADSPKDSVTAAANALGAEKNYSWHQTVEVPADSPFKPGPTDGKTEKDGYTDVTMSFNDNTSQAIIHGTNVAVKADGDWQSAAEATANNGGGFNPTAFLARVAQNLKTPAAEAATLATQAKELTAGTNGITGDLTDEVVKAQLTFRRRAGANTNNAPNVSNPKGSVTFWVADKKLTKYQYHVSGTISFTGTDRDVDRTTTVEIKDVGTTKIEVPDDAKKKLQ